ncbi:arylsulfotransferase family protein [Amylibacter sp.]|nr:arylsulfotransferase family protein [Amylibacter sp.]
MAKQYGENHMSKFLEKLPKLVFLACITFTIVLGAFIYGALAQSRNWPPVPQIKQVRIMLTSTTSLFDQGQGHHLQPNRGQGAGVTVNQNPADQSLVFMSGFFDGENQARLIARDGTLIHKWSLDYFSHFPDLATRPCALKGSLFVDTHGALVTPERELVFNYEYCGIVKLGYCGAPEWTIGTPGHHSLIEREDGGYLALGRDVWSVSENPDRFPPYSILNESLQEDTLLWISDTGEITREASIPQLMNDSGLEAVLTAGSNYGPELVHANKVSELTSAYAVAYPLFNAGDLAISIRNHNLVLIIDSTTLAVKWHQIGPWLKQHDTEFRSDGRLSVFNNNTYITGYKDKQTDLTTAQTTNIIAMDPTTRVTEILFGEKPGQEMLSVIRGQHELLPNDGILITEFDAGRVIEVNSDREIVWEYVNEYDEEFVGEVTNADVYPAGYFETDLPTCQS